jgi:DTW domain-containing protein YfiP
LIRHDPPGGHRARAGQLPRCVRCGFHLRLCLCAELRPLALATRVVVLSSPREVPQPTNTGRLVPLALSGGEVRVVAPRGPPLVREELVDPAHRTLLLFPSDDARPLARAAEDARPVTLIVPDGTWRKARRIAARESALAGLERVTLPPGPGSRYRLRAHPDARCLATFEAVARALGILEGPEVQARLERVFALFVERTLFSRGRLGGELPQGIGRRGRLRWHADPDELREVGSGS